MADAPDPRRWWTLGVLGLSLLVIGIDNNILNVAMPTLVRKLGATPSQLQWIVDSYVLVFVGLLLISGRLGDRLGRKGVMTAGLVVFGTSSLLAALSSSATQLIACRAVMGVGAALIMPATLSILVNVFTDPAERRRAIAYWSLMNATSAFIGPVTGGLLLRQFAWGSVFLINVPIVAVALAAGRVLVPTSRDPDAGKFDLVGAGLSAAALGALLWGIIEGPSKGWGEPVVLFAFPAALALGFAFVRWELRAPDPMVDIVAFRRPRLSGAAVAVMIAFVAMSGSMFLVIQSLQLVKGYTPLTAALATSVPICTVNFLWMPRAPRMIERFTAKRMVVGGIGTISLAAMMISTTTAHSSYLFLFVAFALMALAFSSFLPASTETIMAAVPAQKAGAGSAINQMARQLGQALGVAMAGSVAASAYPGGFSAKEVPGVSTAALDTARGSITGAVRVASQLTGDARAVVLDAAHHAFIHGMRTAMAATATIALLGALYAAKVIPSGPPPVGADLTDDDATLGQLVVD
ncbi:MAG: MFS transporter [Acidobacteria bacterium]|nr:MFS transporter [Acidobacteriota bacterium]